ncbi:MAG: hypothetical protein Q9199_008188 [Rusavskia elegans]
MAFTQPYQTPDLAAVLRTLAACAPARVPPIQQTQQDDLEEGEYDPSEFHPIISHPAQPAPPTPHSSQQYNEHNPPQLQPPQSNYNAPNSHKTNLLPAPSAPSNPSPQLLPPSATDESLRGLEARHIARLMRELAGNKPEVARRLGIGLTTLYRKLQEYEL